jgi:hypothetical protein
MKKVIVIAALMLVGAVVAISGTSSQTGQQAKRRFETVYGWNIHDPRRVAGRQEHLFFGEVMAGPEVLPPFGPEGRVLSVYRVQVTEALKGGIAGEVLVTQKSVLDASGTPVLIGGEALEVGASNFFATVTEHLPDGRIAHRALPESGEVPIDSPDKRDELRSIYKKALRDPITAEEDRAAANP